MTIETIGYLTLVVAHRALSLKPKRRERMPLLS